MFHSIFQSKLLKNKTIKCDDITIPSKQNNDKIPLKWISKLSVVAFCVYLATCIFKTMYDVTSYSSMIEISKRGNMAHHYNGERTIKMN